MTSIQPTDPVAELLAVIAARAHLSGDADAQLRRIIDESGSQPPFRE